MRKATYLGLGMLMGAMAFAASPALAGYQATDVMNDQADHSTFAGINWLAIGAAADENPNYKPGTIVIPYVGMYGWAGCPTNVTDTAGNQIPSSYNCVDELAPDAQDGELILQDIFGQVTEGSVAKLDNAQGIEQYLDGLFSQTSDGNPLNGTETVLINQTLDQDLADLTMGAALDTHALGIWQRLHTAFSKYAENYDAAADTASYDADGIDQTVEAFVQEEGGNPLLAGYVISYMGQWFQKGTNQDCSTVDPADLSGPTCAHTEFGGHGAVTSTPYDAAAAAAAHDP